MISVPTHCCIISCTLDWTSSAAAEKDPQTPAEYNIYTYREKKKTGYHEVFLALQSIWCFLQSTTKNTSTYLLHGPNNSSLSLLLVQYGHYEKIMLEFKDDFPIQDYNTDESPVLKKVPNLIEYKYSLRASLLNVFTMTQTRYSDIYTLR